MASGSATIACGFSEAPAGVTLSCAESELAVSSSAAVTTVSFMSILPHREVQRSGGRAARE
jgi:hypothetical protein